MEKQTKKRGYLKWIIIAIGVIAIFIFASRGMNSEIPYDEQQFIDITLSKITSDSTKDDVVMLLGNPSRDLGLKVNWKIVFGVNESRVGVYFDNKTGKATRINFDGGSGRFYYRKNLD